MRGLRSKARRTRWCTASARGHTSLQRGGDQHAEAHRNLSLRSLHLIRRPCSDEGAQAHSREALEARALEQAKLAGLSHNGHGVNVGARYEAKCCDHSL